MPHPTTRLGGRRLAWSFAATAALIALRSPHVRAAHDVPSDVLVQMFAVASGSHVRVLVRLPLISLLNINLPKRGPYLDLAAVQPALGDAARATAGALDLYEGGRKLGTARVEAVRISLPSDRSFDSYLPALAHVRGTPLPTDTAVVWDQGYFDASLLYDIEPNRSDFAVHPRFASLAPRVVTALDFRLPNGVVRVFQLVDDPGVVQLDPRWYQAASSFVRSGFARPFRAPEYLLFLLCLAIPARGLRNLIPALGAFTVAHSSTLIASAYQIAPAGGWFQPVVSAAIALSVVYSSLHNILFTDDRDHRPLAAVIFGLPHGFALAFALREALQFAGDHRLMSVLSFNAGVELGQLLVIVLLMAALGLVFRYASSQRLGVIVLSALVCHAFWQTTIDRVSALTAMAWPLADRIELARWSAAAALAASAGVVLFGLGRSLFDLRPGGAATFEAVGIRPSASGAPHEASH